LGRRVFDTDTTIKERVAMSGETYTNRGYGAGKIPLGKNPAMLVVDFQNAFPRPALPMGGGDHVVAAVDRSVPVLDAARKAGMLVIHTAVAYEPSLIDMGLWRHKIPAMEAITIGSVHAEIDPKLWDESDTLIIKKWPSAFAGTHLAAMLVERGIDMVFMMGATTSGCIRASVIDAFSLGFPTFIIADCCGDQDAGPHEANINDCTRRYAERMDGHEAIELIKSWPTT